MYLKYGRTINLESKEVFVWTIFSCLLLPYWEGGGGMSATSTTSSLFNTFEVETVAADVAGGLFGLFCCSTPPPITLTGSGPSEPRPPKSADCSVSVANSSEYTNWLIVVFRRNVPNELGMEKMKSEIFNESNWLPLEKHKKSQHNFHFEQIL